MPTSGLHTKVQAHGIETDIQTPAGATAPKRQRAKRIQYLSPSLTFTLCLGLRAVLPEHLKQKKKKNPCK